MRQEHEAGHSPPKRIEGYGVWNLAYCALKGDGDEESAGNKKFRVVRITSIKSLSFCMTSFSPSLAKYPGKYSLHVTKELQ